MPRRKTALRKARRHVVQAANLVRPHTNKQNTPLLFHTFDDLLDILDHLATEGAFQPHRHYQPNPPRRLRQH